MVTTNRSEKVKQHRLSLEDIQSEFLNVDVDVKSRTDTHRKTVQTLFS